MGEPVRLSDVLATAQDVLPPEMRGMPGPMLLQMLPPEIARQLVDRTITERVLTAAARAAGLDQDAEIQRRIRRAEDQELQQACLTPGGARRRHRRGAARPLRPANAGRRQGEEEVHARHILVPTEAEAKAALAEVTGGADFAEVGQAPLQRTRARRDGGDLGFFKRGDMVPEFAEAAFALQPGQVSAAPVRSPFGWHVIKVEERRSAPVAELRGQPPAAAPEDAGGAGGGRGRPASAPPPRWSGWTSPPPRCSTTPPPPAAAPAGRPRRPRSPAPLRKPDPWPDCPSRRSPSRCRRCRRSPASRLGVTEAGIRYKGRADLTMMEFAPGTTVAGVFTRNKCPGAPVDWCRAALKKGKARALVVNAGNANVFTGKAGREATKATAEAAAKLVGCKANEVFLASTGVIGETMPHERLTAALPGPARGADPGRAGTRPRAAS